MAKFITNQISQVNDGFAIVTAFTMKAKTAERLVPRIRLTAHTVFEARRMVMAVRFSGRIMEVRMHVDVWTQTRMTTRMGDIVSMASQIMFVAERKLCPLTGQKPDQYQQRNDCP